ncbi:MAG: galactose-1-phosphate uridylyltransferase, partial [Blastocatellia bacterium]
MTWEQRWHPLREEWIIVAAHRQNRPWSGETVPHKVPSPPDYVSDCYLCPGNQRVSGRYNQDYTSTFVFDNDHPCVGLDAPRQLEIPTGIYRNMPAAGIARVVCYSPRHNLTLAELQVDEVFELLNVWQQQHRELAGYNEIKHVLVFENKGEVVGVSNPHPHCQIYATNFVFKTIETEARVSELHLAETGRVLFQDILSAESEDGRRIVVESEDSLAFIPYFARYAYEVYVAPKRTAASIADLSEAEVRDFADVLKKLLVKLDNLWT